MIGPAADARAERAQKHIWEAIPASCRSDGHSGYAALARLSQQLSLAFCWSHVIRKFYEVADSLPVATEVQRRIAILYELDDEVRGTSASSDALFAARRPASSSMNGASPPRRGSVRSAPRASSPTPSATRRPAGPDCRCS
nr:transposase [Novosphingobium sp. MD-1]